MAEHTKLPWFQDGSYVTDRGDGLIGRSIADCAKSPNIDRAEQQANAAFIVQAVNNHEVLLAAAERVCWFDWSDNDRDAAAAVEELRRVVNAVVGGAAK